MLLTVSARTARESMSLDDALKALAFGDTRNLKKVARSKNRNINRVPFFHFTLVARLQSEFFQCFIKSAFHGSGASFTNFSFFLRSKTHLDRIVAIFIFGKNPGHSHRPCSKYRDRN